MSYTYTLKCLMEQGISISKQIADLHGLQVTFNHREGGGFIATIMINQRQVISASAKRIRGQISVINGD